MDGGAYNTVPTAIQNKLSPGGRIAYVQVAAHSTFGAAGESAGAVSGASVGVSGNVRSDVCSFESPSLEAPLCQAVVLRKASDGSFDPPLFVCQLHLPRLNASVVQNQPFQF
jgi:hypothetical protein